MGGATPAGQVSEGSGYLLSEAFLWTDRSTHSDRLPSRNQQIPANQSFAGNPVEPFAGTDSLDGFVAQNGANLVQRGAFSEHCSSRRVSQDVGTK